MPLPYYVPYFQFCAIVSRHCRASESFFVQYRRFEHGIEGGSEVSVRLDVNEGTIKQTQLELKDCRRSRSKSPSAPRSKSSPSRSPRVDTGLVGYGGWSKFMCARTVNLAGPAVCYL